MILQQFHIDNPFLIVRIRNIRTKLKSVKFDFKAVGKMNPLSNNALKVLQSRYLLKDKWGNITETPEELFHRVSVFVSQAEGLYNSYHDQKMWADIFFHLLSSLKFLPNSPTLMNAGLPQGQLSACYVMPLENDDDFVNKVLRETLQIQKSGGGTGFNFSSFTSTAKGSDFEEVGTNAITYIEKFNNAMNTIKTLGKRNGANMAILNVDHPDIEKFIQSKQDDHVISNFNISVGVTDEFMNAVMHDHDWKLKDPQTGETIQNIKAKALWNKIIFAAWNKGDPGLVFLDAIERSNPTPLLGKLRATNPCGEVPLLPYEACNLGSINLSLMVKEKGKSSYVDWNELRNTIITAIRFLDNVIDVNYYSIPEIEHVVKGNRKIGLGVMGWAEFLVKLGLRYDSEEAIMMGKKVMQFIKQESIKASLDIAKQRGTFGNWEHSVHYPHLPLRNATLNSIAPTGTISIIANTSASIEPFFALSYERRNILDGETIYEINPLLEKYILKFKDKYPNLIKTIVSRGYLTNRDDAPGLVKDLFKTSLQIPYYYHIKHQIAFQEYTDNAVSKTINLPQDCTTEDVDIIYKMAWKSGLKGITIYRYGSKEKQVLYQGRSTKENISVDRNCKFCID